MTPRTASGIGGIGFRLLVFDWDGTLMDSVATIVACTQAVIGELGLAAPPEKTIRGTIGLGLRETIDVLCPGSGDDLYGRIVDCYHRHWFATYRDLPVLFPGVEAMLEELAGQGYLLGSRPARAAAGSTTLWKPASSNASSTPPARPTRRTRSPIRRCCSTSSTISGWRPATR